MNPTKWCKKVSCSWSIENRLSVKKAESTRVKVLYLLLLHLCFSDLFCFICLFFKVKFMLNLVIYQEQ